MHGDDDCFLYKDRLCISINERARKLFFSHNNCGALPTIYIYVVLIFEHHL
jgi:hypothetical protein